MLNEGNEGVNDCVIFDMDGTMTNPSHRLHFIEGENKHWDDFHAAGGMDPVNTHIRVLYHSIYLARYQIVICTGRPESYRAMTVRYLCEHVRLPHHLMLMRAEGDYRIDEVIKAEMLQILRDEHKLNPVLAIDDRPNVAKMFIAAGVPTILNLPMG